MRAAATAEASRPTLASALWQETGWMRAVILVLCGTAALTLSAKINVPFYPVPMTMQTFVVLVLGAAYGWRLAAVTVLAYLAQGAVGIPVFAGTPEKGIGLAYMMGPTGGYLIGFLVAAIVVGLLAERGFDRSPFLLFAAMLLGHVVIFACGIAWLGSLIGYDKAWASGVAPFYYATLFKTALGALIVPAAWYALDKRKAD
jgi:biotin transport system substrate-specific component